MHESFVAISFIFGAILLRSPALLYSVLNYDESMYLLMGAEFARGHMPYTTVCDLKPFGLFALATPFTMLPIDPVIAARIGSSVTVGLTAWMLSRHRSRAVPRWTPRDRYRRGAWLSDLQPCGWRHGLPR